MRREYCKRRRKRRNGDGFGDTREAFRLNAPSWETSIKKEFSLLSYCLLNSMYLSFCILIDSTTRVLSRKVVNFVLSSCKFKFLTYHLRDNFLGVYRIKIGYRSFFAFRFWIYVLERSSLRIGLFQGHEIAIESAVNVSLCNLRFVYSFLFSIPWRHSGWHTYKYTYSEFSLINYNYTIVFFKTIVDKRLSNTILKMSSDLSYWTGRTSFESLRSLY